MGKKSWKSWKEDASKNKISRLDNWKKNGSVTVWLHTKSGIYQKGQHVVPYIWYNKEKKKDEVKFFFFNCHEDYDTLRYKNPPEHCPIDLFINWLEENDDIKDDDLVWDCEAGKINRSMTKYDFLENWKTKMNAKLKSVLPVINDEDPKEVIVTEETVSIEMGIFKAIEDYGKKLLEYGEDIDLSDPDVNPYPFKWEYNPNASQPIDYYNVVALDRKKPTQEILELLNGSEVDLSAFIVPGDSKRLRTIMEDHIVLEDVPFDELFANVKDKETTKYNYNTSSESVDDMEQAEEEAEEEVKEEPKKTRKTKKKESEVKTCPDCGEPLSYDEDGNVEECECQYEEVYECSICGRELEEGEECTNCICEVCGSPLEEDGTCKKCLEEEKKKKEEKKPVKRRRVKK